MSPNRDNDRFFTVTLTWPPSQNQSIRSGFNRKTGKINIYHTKEVNDWKAKAEKACAECHSEITSVFVGDPVEMHISLYPPSNRPDIDGVEKKILDALQGHAYTNDRQVFKKTTERTIETHPDDAHIIVRVWLFGTSWPLGYDLSPNAGKSFPFMGISDAE